MFLSSQWMPFSSPHQHTLHLTTMQSVRTDTDDYDDDDNNNNNYNSYELAGSTYFAMTANSMK
jgi:hypothetical protein